MNANIALMRTRRANKAAKRRLKQAERFLKQEDKPNFYNEVLRALWGYFSDKLSIPVANLTKNNIGAELSSYGVEESFARYAPVESSAAMDEIYKEATDAIGKMENVLKTKK